MAEAGTHSEQNEKLDFYVCLALAGEGDEIPPALVLLVPLQLIYIDAHIYIHMQSWNSAGESRPGENGNSLCTLRRDDGRSTQPVPVGAPRSPRGSRTRTAGRLLGRRRHRGSAHTGPRGGGGEEDAGAGWRRQVAAAVAPG